MSLPLGLLDLDELDQSYMVVVQLKHQPQGVIHRVALRPDKIAHTLRTCSCCGTIKRSVIVRLGDSPGDEAAGWQYPENIQIVAILGKAEIISPTEIKVHPLD